ncbi:MAG: hypothetical protein MJ078_05900 [Clostridia bacterium]|nr:hypothetical protein [Clostridia bacterium]
MCVPKCARHPEVAMEYINFLLSEEAAVTVSEYMGYASANKLVYENEDYIAYMEDWYEDAMAVTYPDGVLIDNERDLKDLDPEEERRSFYRTIGNTEENGNLLDFTNNLWSELKVESSTESWIIVTDIVILAALAGWLIFKAVRKKAREKEY